MCNIMAKVFLNRNLWRKIIEFAGLSDNYKYQIIYEIVVSLCSALKDARFDDETINDIVGIKNIAVTFVAVCLPSKRVSFICSSLFYLI